MDALLATVEAMDDATVVGWAFFGSILVAIALYALIRRVNRTNPMNHTRRVVNGRKAMATDWRRPAYLPEAWK